MTGTIEKLPDGRYELAVPNQGGRDRFWARTEADAVEMYRGNYSFLNGVPESEVYVPEVINRREWPIVFVTPERNFELAHERIADAINLSLRGVQGGRKYRMRVVLDPIEGAPSYEGQGI